MVAELNDYQPEAVITYAGVGAMLAEEQLQGRLHIEPSLVVVGSEVLTEDAEQRMADAWGIRPCNVYAATEAPPIALSSSERGGLHIFEDFVILEVVDEHGRAVPAGTPGHKVLLTNLVNRAQPLIRYELSDSLTMADGPDSSGLPYLPIERVDGRNDDILRFPAAGGGEAVLHPFRLRSPFAKLPDVLQYQILHGGQRLRVRVVLRSTAPGDTPAVVHDALRLALEEARAVPPPIDVEPVAAIERESGNGAKLKLVKRLD
jgi:phenylacetate-coenzyme A ligase PaaK-like adenylate-forming protein